MLGFFLSKIIQTTEQDAFVGALYKQACQDSILRSEKALTSKQEFFFTSTFLAKEDQLETLKAALRKTILQYVDESIVTDGDRLVQLVTALHL